MQFGSPVPIQNQGQADRIGSDRIEARKPGSKIGPDRIEKRRKIEKRSKIKKKTGWDRKCFCFCEGSPSSKMNNHMKSGQSFGYLSEKWPAEPAAFSIFFDVFRSDPRIEDRIGQFASDRTGSDRIGSIKVGSDRIGSKIEDRIDPTRSGSIRSKPIRLHTSTRRLRGRLSCISFVANSFVPPPSSPNYRSQVRNKQTNKHPPGRIKNRGSPPARQITPNMTQSK